MANKKTRKNYPTALKAKVLKDYQKGTRVIELAKRYGASVPTLYLWLRKEGVTRPRGRVAGGGAGNNALQLRIRRLELEVKRQRKNQLRLVRTLQRSLEKTLAR
jgi:transposase-like protein